MTEDEDKPESADDQLKWIVLAFIVLMLSLMAINTWL